MITKKTTDYTDLNFVAGEVLLIDKPMGWTSFKVVHEIRKHTHARKVGHAGTLDPKATGLLILCTGKLTKEINQYQDKKKTYSGTICLGARTPSLDSETPVSETHPIDNISDAKILLTRNKFIGDISQLPPMYSAANYGGKKLYRLARQGRVVPREPRKVRVERFDIIKIEMPYVHFEIECSKGTYIRSIADDFGTALGCGAYLSALRRLKIGDFSVTDALAPAEFVRNLEPWKKNSALKYALPQDSDTEEDEIDFSEDKVID